MRILFPTIISGVSTRKDKSLSVRLETQELNPETSANLMRLHGNICYCMLKSEPVDDEDNLIADELDTVKKPKTQSQRLRNVLYLCWKKDSEGYEGFDSYYLAKTDVIISGFKNKLNDEVK